VATVSQGSHEIWIHLSTSIPDSIFSLYPLIACTRIEYSADPKLQNAGTFKLEREDHTLGNLLRMQLLDDERVIFVGYKQPHPLQHHIILKVQTVPGPYTPKSAVASAVECLTEEVTSILNSLEMSGV
jgi:DNA-directed RNA polymerase II subunit RPB11